MIEAVENNRTSIILTQRTDHVMLLTDMLKKQTDANFITIITLPSESYREQERAKKCIELLQTKVNVKTIPDIYPKYVIIDKQLVWYGSIGLLDYIDSDDTIIRLEYRELAEELKVSKP